MSLKLKVSAKPPKRTVALCYIRQSMTKSETDQDKADHAEAARDTPPKKQRGPDLDSPERQRTNIQAMCDRKGWTPRWFVDAEGHKSGRQEKNRPGWLDLKAHLDDPDVVAIVANDLSRLHRKGWRVGQLIEWIEEHHLFLALAAPGRELDLSDPRDRLNASFISMMDEYYAADIAQRMRDSVAHRRSEGKTVGPAPFGTIRDEAGYLKPSPFGAWQLPGASTVAGQIGDVSPGEDAVWRGYHDCAKRILELYSANQHGLKVIAAQMVTEGWRFRSRTGTPRRITQADVRQVIANWRAYAGLVVPGRARDMTAYQIGNAPEILYDTGRSVFDLALIRKVAEVQTTRSFSTRPFGSVSASYCYPLTGVLYCARCEYRARVEKDTELRAKIGGTNKYSRLHYRHYQGTPCTCQRKSVHADEVEADFQRLLELLSTSAEHLPSLVSHAHVEHPATNAQSSPLDADGTAEDNLAKGQRRLEAVRYLFEDGDLSREEYVRRNEQLAREIAHWEAQRVARDAPADELGRYAESFQRMAHLWPVTTPEDKQILIRSLFESVYYDMDTKRIIDFQLKPGADRYLIARFALYEDEGCQADRHGAIPDAPASRRHFDGWSVLCPEGGFNPYPAPRLQWRRRDFVGICTGVISRRRCHIRIVPHIRSAAMR